jgi:hypothetical protein
MRKNLLYLFFFLSGTTHFQAEVLPTEIHVEKAFTAPINVAVSNISMSSAKVTWDPVSGSTGYMLRYRPVGSGAWVSIQVINNTEYTLTNLQSCTVYEVQVIDNISGDNSGSLIFSTYLNYCIAASTDSSVMHISNVTVTPFAGLPQMISNSGASNYTDYRSDPTRQIQFELGTPNNQLSVSQTWSGTPTPAAVRAWIDFNGNGVFEPSETLLLSNLSTTSTLVSTFNIPTMSSIISPTSCGVTMRVISSQTLNIPSCGTFTYGEVEDYGVILKSPTLAVEETSVSKEVTMYPNPASDIVHISGIAPQTDFEIFTAAGQKVMEGKTSDGTITISHLTKGIYFIQIKNKENLNRLKLIKK